MIETGEGETRYFIDLEWYRENGRSFPALARSRLCPSSQGVAAEEPHQLLAHFRDCCSKEEAFLNPNLPILEIIFRIFLQNGNQPLALEQIHQQLKEWKAPAGLFWDIPEEKLRRLLENDHYYGLAPLPKGEEA